LHFIWEKLAIDCAAGLQQWEPGFAAIKQKQEEN
jgi:hypothetical protein